MKIPAPDGDPDAPLKALIFDAVYDSYKGVIVFFRVRDGKVAKGTKVRMMATGAEFDVVEVGYFGAGQFIPCDELSAGYGRLSDRKYKKFKGNPCGRYNHRCGASL